MWLKWWKELEKWGPQKNGGDRKTRSVNKRRKPTDCSVCFKEEAYIKILYLISSCAVDIFCCSCKVHSRSFSVHIKRLKETNWCKMWAACRQHWLLSLCVSASIWKQRDSFTVALRPSSRRHLYIPQYNNNSVRTQSTWELNLAVIKVWWKKAEGWTSHWGN